MTEERAKKIQEVLAEITELEKIKDLRESQINGIKFPDHPTHFEVVLHYGQLQSYDRVQIDARHNLRLLKVIDEIISELCKEFETL